MSTEIEEISKKYNLEPKVVAKIIKKYNTIENFIQMYRENKVSDEEINLFKDLIDIDCSMYNENYSNLVHAIFGGKRFDTKGKVNDIQMYSSRIIDEVLLTLNPRRAVCIRERFGLDSGIGKTLKECGSILNVTTERARQIEAKALRELRHPSRSKQIRPISISCETLKNSMYITGEEKVKLSELENELWESDLIFKHNENPERINFDITKLSIIQNIIDNIETRRKEDIAYKEKSRIKAEAIKNAERKVEKSFLHRELEARRRESNTSTGEMSLDDLNFSVRSLNSLKRAGFENLRDIEGLTYEELDKIRNLRQKDRKEIVSKLAEYGIRIKSEAELVDEDETLEDVLKAKDEAMAQARDEVIRYFEQQNIENVNIYYMPIEELEFSIRTFNCLKRAGIYSLGGLKELTEDDLGRIRNLGPKNKEEIISKLAEYGIMSENEVESEAETEEDKDKSLSLEELIEIAENTDPKSKQYNAIQKMLIQRVKEQQNIIVEQQSKIDSLQSIVNDKRRKQHDEQ